MTVEYKEFPEHKMVEITVDGKVTQAEFEDIAPRMEAFMADHGDVKIIEIIKSLRGFELSMLSSGIKFDVKHMKHFSHCAVVSDSGWIGPFARLMSPLFSLEIRSFKMNKEQQARDWLKSA